MTYSAAARAMPTTSGQTLTKCVHHASARRPHSRLCERRRMLERRFDTSHLLLDRGAQQAGRPDEQNQDQQREHVHVAIVRRDVKCPELLDEGDHEAAQHGAADVADAADHRGHKRLQPQAAPKSCGPADSARDTSARTETRPPPPAPNPAQT